MQNWFVATKINQIFTLVKVIYLGTERRFTWGIRWPHQTGTSERRNLLGFLFQLGLNWFLLDFQVPLLCEISAKTDCPGSHIKSSSLKSHLILESNLLPFPMKENRCHLKKPEKIEKIVFKLFTCVPFKRWLIIQPFTKYMYLLFSKHYIKLKCITD